jgi:tetratricopeptide (TPR) repeat protein
MFPCLSTLCHTPQALAKDRSDSAGRRPGRNTTFQAEAYQKGDELDPIHPQDLMDPDATGSHFEGEVDGFHQATAMFDKGQFLGELADLQDGGPDTRAAAETLDAPKGCRLIIVAGPDIGLEWSFKQPEVVIGRDEDCQLTLNDINVSRKHAKIAPEGKRYYLSDLGSGNGTYLNGIRVERRVELSPGDEIVIGERTLRFVELTDAPATAAAHPVSPGIREPLIGDVGAIDDEASFRQIGNKSQVDVGALAGNEEPIPGTKQVPRSLPPEPQQGAALKKTLIAFSVIAVLVALGIGGWLIWEKSREEETEAQRIARAKKEFLQGIELAKAKRCGDAMLLFTRVLVVRPDHPRAKEYLAYCEKELAVWKQLEEAKKLGDIGRYTMALEMLDTVPTDTLYTEDLMRMKERYQTAIARQLVKEAEKLFEQKEYERALDLVARALERAPNLVEAKELLDRIEEAAKKPDGLPKKPKVVLPPALQRAVALYKNAQIGPAIDAAEVAGGPESVPYVERMKRVKQLLDETKEAHRQKAAGEILRLAPAALEIDKEIAGGEGKVREKLGNLYADGLYLKGVAALASQDFVESFRLLKEATKQKPGHKLAESRLLDLSRKAEQTYFEAYVTKDKDQAEARKLFKRVTQMTPPTNQYHQKAQDWLRANSG